MNNSLNIPSNITRAICLKPIKSTFKIVIADVEIHIDQDRVDKITHI